MSTSNPSPWLRAEAAFFSGLLKERRSRVPVDPRNAVQTFRRPEERRSDVPVDPRNAAKAFR